MSIARRWFLLSALAVLFTACDQAPESTPSAEVVADTALLSAEAVAIAQFGLVPVQMSPWRDAWHVPAHIALDPAATQPMGSIVEGRVLAVRVFPGDRVKAGQILAEIHSHEVMDAREQLVAARAAATSADSVATVAVAAAGRAERLLAARAISPAEAERTRAARVAAGAARESAHAALERATALVEHLIGPATPDGVDEHAALIRAPFDGVITGRTAQPGQVVLVGQPLLTIAREGRLGVLLHLPEEAVASVAIGVPVTLTVPAYPDRTFTARVQRIAPVVDSLSRSIQVWAAIDGAGQSLLRAEMTSDAQLLGGRGDRTLTIPAAALQIMEGDTVVVRASRVGDGLLLEARPVRAGRRTSEQVEILSGIGIGDTVIARGAALGKAEILKRKAGGEGGHDH